jgi:hypothetical protein
MLIDIKRFISFSPRNNAAEGQLRPDADAGPDERCPKTEQL